METGLASNTAHGTQHSFTVGQVHVTVIASHARQLMHFLLHRTDTNAPGNRLLIGSGSTHGLASCIEQATRAARRAEP